MRVLVVEDDLDYLSDLRTALGGIEGLDLQVVRSRDSAHQILENEAYDIIICDLRLPTEDGGLDKEVEHGISVVSKARSVLPGSLVLVHSGYADRKLTRKLINRAPREDLIGTNEQQPLIDVIHKGDLTDCVERVGDYKCQIEELETITIGTGLADIELGDFEARPLRIFARRHGGRVVRLQNINGGLSPSKVLRLRLVGAGGGTRALAVTKVASIDVIKHEEQQYNDFVTPLLRNGAYAVLMDAVRAGAGRQGALFYRVSEDSSSLFSVLDSDPERATELLDLLQQELARWHEGRPTDHTSVRDIRRRVVDDETMADLADAHLEDIDWESFEEEHVQVRRVVAHGDLHGENVLIEDGRPLLIDFGEVHEGAASLDPLTLELSLLFHPSGREQSGSWPSPGHAEMWHTIEQYTSDCPVSGFVRRCRQWAFDVEEDDRAVYANLYVHSLRQLKYPDTDDQLSCALIRSALAGFRQT